MSQDNTTDNNTTDNDVNNNVKRPLDELPSEEEPIGPNKKQRKNTEDDSYTNENKNTEDDSYTNENKNTEDEPCTKCGVKHRVCYNAGPATLESEDGTSYIMGMSEEYEEGEYDEACDDVQDAFNTLSKNKEIKRILTNQDDEVVGRYNNQEVFSWEIDATRSDDNQNQWKMAMKVVPTNESNVDFSKSSKDIKKAIVNYFNNNNLPEPTIEFKGKSVAIEMMYDTTTCNIECIVECILSEYYNKV